MEPRQLILLATLYTITTLSTINAGMIKAQEINMHDANHWNPVVYDLKSGKPDPDAMTTNSEMPISYTLTAGGREAYMGMDEGRFAGIETEDLNFTFIARIKSAQTESQNPKYGLTLRQTPQGHSKAINIRFDGYKHNQCIQWFMRYRVAKGNAQGHKVSFRDGLNRAFKSKDGMWMKIVRRYPIVETYASEDGKTWEPIAPGYQKVFLPQKAFIGLQVTAGGNGAPTANITYDHISYTVDKRAPSIIATTPQDLIETSLPQREWRYILLPVSWAGNRAKRESIYIMFPKDMDPANMRGYHWTTGSKEITLNGKAIEYDKREGERKPKVMPDYEGEHIFTGNNENLEMMYNDGLILLGGFVSTDQIDLEKVLAQFAEKTGIPELANLPFVATGDSFAGGRAASALLKNPQRTVAAVPVMIGVAGYPRAEAHHFNVPLMYVYGSIDGGKNGHHKHIRDTMPKLLKNKAIWGAATQWWVGHWHDRADALIYPYFSEMLKARVPAGHDFSQGPAKLLPLSYEDGWYGQINEKPNNYPVITPVKDTAEVTDNMVWLPNEKIAKIWRAFNSERSAPVIHFPKFEGDGNPLLPAPNGWQTTNIPADQDFRLIASGPISDDLKVRYYINSKEVKPIATHGSPYNVTLPAQVAGVHTLYLETDFNGKTEVSRPVMVMFVSK